MSTPARRRLMRDFKRLQQDPPAGVSGAPSDNNIMLWNAVIFGPHDTPFEDGTFKLTIEFTEEYPNKPPTVRSVVLCLNAVPQHILLTNAGLSARCSTPTSTLTEASAWTFCRTAGHPPTTCQLSSPLSRVCWTSLTLIPQPIVLLPSYTRKIDVSMRKELLPSWSRVG